MIRKFCPKCKSYSYSASSQDPWNCATCGYSLSDRPMLAINEISPEDNEDAADFRIGVREIFHSPK